MKSLMIMGRDYHDKHKQRFVHFVNVQIAVFKKISARNVLFSLSNKSPAIITKSTSCCNAISTIFLKLS